MPYTTNVPGTTITAAYGNANIRDQVITPFASSAARASAISSPIEGMLSYLSDTDRLDAYDGSAWTLATFAASLQYARRTANQSVTSSTTLVDDDTFQFTVRANAVYELRALISYVAATAGDLKIGWSGPAGAAFDWQVGGPPSTAASNVESVYYGSNNLAGTDIVGGAGVSGMSCRPSGILVVAGTAGTFKMQFAQGTSSATATTIASGATFATLTRLA